MATLKGRVLLGWMPRDDAIKFLLDDCVFDPPIDAAAAETLWRAYRTRVEALPVRAYAVSPSLGLTLAEVAHTTRLMTFLASIGRTEMIGVKKVDLRDLTVRQYHVVTERAQDYTATVQDPHGWLNECLPLAPNQAQYSWSFQQAGMHSYTEIDVPHGEWMFSPIGVNTGTFAPVQAIRHVTAMDGTDRTFLWAGYHRSFARVLTTPIANAPMAVVAVARNVLTSPVGATAAPAVATGNGIDAFGPLGAKAARFGDFFVDGLFMEVDLRKKRYQLQVHANWVAIDDPT